MFRLKFWLISLILIFIAVLTVKFLKPTTIEVVHPTRGLAVQSVYATGTVEATVMLPLAPRMTARLLELKADEGAIITKDQILAQLEDEDMQNSLKELIAKESYAKSEFSRNDSAYKQGAVSTQILTKAKSDWDGARAAVAKAQTETGFMKLTAPADGVIVRRDGEVGQLISANQPIFWITGNEPLRISSEVDEEDIADVKIGQTVLIQADAFLKQVFHGKVNSVTPKGDPVARSYRVRIEFTELVPLKIGMTAETNIIISENKNALLIPAGALIDGKVWKIKDDLLNEEKVLIGAKGAEKIEIKEGISEQDLVVLKPDSELKTGKKVSTKIVEQNS